MGIRSRNRTSGFPPSANGASSFHLRWGIDGSWTSLSVDLTIELAPSVRRLYFWAMQVDFASDDGSPAGGAHLGLQWHPGHPGSRAVNWGGYGRDGRELKGSASALTSATSNPNTRDFAWEPLRTYRLKVEQADSEISPSSRSAPPPGHRAWSATITDTLDHRTTVIRDLFVPASRVRAVLVWSEVFARCDDPPTQVLWSDPQVVTADGQRSIPDRAAVNYQTLRDGGCTNTCSWSDAVGLRQRTNASREIAQGTVLRWYS